MTYSQSVSGQSKKQSVLLAITDKHVGEMDVEETEETLTDPNQRIIRQVTISDANTAKKLFDDLMGTSVTPRKAYIKAHSEEATYNQE